MVSMTLVLKITLAIVILMALAIVFFFFFPIIQICGNSMFPTLKDGQFFIGVRVIRKSKCKKGEIYVFNPPYTSSEEKFVIKRLTDINSEGKYFFEGDNSKDSYDSRYYGYVDCHNVVAKLNIHKKGV